MVKGSRWWRAHDLTRLDGEAVKRRSTRESHSGRLGKRSGFRDRFLVYAGRAPLKLNSELIFTGGNKENEALKAWHLCCLRYLLFQ